ncbi:hypothetical protein [Butyrivibrio sp. MB2005]|uniref:hypothetical protein n=1 Tax=Butyrivibrio sp. MB2005 TaxID=1280678 RepID=UPI00041FD307|nr:hypothetical protein [Butyrivibrio sp. MB2005]
MRGLFSTVIVIAVAMGVICGCTSEKSDVSVVAPDGTGSVAEREEPSFGIADEHAVENPENAIADISVEEPDDIESEASDTDPKENEQVTESINSSLDSIIEEHNQDTEFVKISKCYIDIISDEEFECDECGLIYLDDSGYPNLIVKSDQGLYPFYSIYRIDHGSPVCIYEGAQSGGTLMGASYYEKQGIISEATHGFRLFGVCEWVSRLVDNEFQTVCRIDYDDPEFENISEDEIDSKLNWYIEVDGHKTYMSRDDCYEEMKKYEGYGNPKDLFDAAPLVSKEYMLTKLKSIYNTQNQTDNEEIDLLKKNLISEGIDPDLISDDTYDMIISVIHKNGYTLNDIEIGDFYNIAHYDELDEDSEINEGIIEQIIIPGKNENFKASLARYSNSGEK